MKNTVLSEKFYQVEYHITGVNVMLHSIMSEEYMRHRNAYANVFNEHIADANNSFHQIYGDVDVMENEEIERAYYAHISEYIQPHFDELNSKGVSLLLTYYVNPNNSCDIHAKIRGYDESDIYLTLKEVGP